MSGNLMRNIYFSLANSYLCYGIALWGFVEYSSAMTSLKKVHKRVFKKMVRNDTNVIDIFKYWNVLKIEDFAKFTQLNNYYFTNWGAQKRS
jgi:hypothetical protein